MNYLMTKILRYLYKKAHKIPRKMITSEKTRDFIESAYLQLYFEQERYQLIYLDEFHVSMKGRSAYNWSYKAALPLERSILILRSWASLSHFPLQGLKVFWHQTSLSNPFHSESLSRRFGIQTENQKIQIKTIYAWFLITLLFTWVEKMRNCLKFKKSGELAFLHTHPNWTRQKDWLLE